MKIMRNAGYTLKEIFAMDAYEMMINLGCSLYDNDREGEEDEQ